MRTCIYIDGFNLYYRAKNSQWLRNQRESWKWLDLRAMCGQVLTEKHDIRAIKYFTARVSSTRKDPSKAQRQDRYFKALQHYRPEVEIYYGHFLTRPAKALLATPTGGKHTVEIMRTEEKGSDVNLAVHLLNDGWLNLYDCAVVISNDSDLAEAMRLVKQEHADKQIGLMTLGRGKLSRHLQKHADFFMAIRGGVLVRSQLPSPVPGTNFRKPPSW